jgi:hypothetical protein
VEEIDYTKDYYEYKDDVSVYYIHKKQQINEDPVIHELDIVQIISPTQVGMATQIPMGMPETCVSITKEVFEENKKRVLEILSTI